MCLSLCFCPFWHFLIIIFLLAFLFYILFMYFIHTRSNVQVQSDKQNFHSTHWDTGLTYQQITEHVKYQKYKPVKGIIPTEYAKDSIEVTERFSSQGKVSWQLLCWTTEWHIPQQTWQKAEQLKDGQLQDTQGVNARPDGNGNKIIAKHVLSIDGAHITVHF